MGYPSPSQVLNGVVYGANNELTGKYVPVSNSDVRAGISYGVSTSPEVGNLVSPNQNLVRFGTTYGSTNEYVGNLVIPDRNDVRNPVQYGSNGIQFTGRMIPVSSWDVREGTEVGLTTSPEMGRLRIPTVGAVRSGVAYGAPDSSSGIYEFIGNLTLPATYYVVLGKSYGANGTELTGTFHCDRDPYEPPPR